MIDIVERPSETGKLIHLNPRDWKCQRKIEEALFTEEHGQYDTPDKYPIGTVAELRATEFGVTYYLIKQANGSWRQITPPFINYGDLSLEINSVIRSTLTILYNPDNDKSQSHEEPSAMYLIQIPTPSTSSTGKSSYSPPTSTQHCTPTSTIGTGFTTKPVNIVARKPRVPKATHTYHRHFNDISPTPLTDTTPMRGTPISTPSPTASSISH